MWNCINVCILKEKRFSLVINSEGGEALQRLPKKLVGTPSVEVFKAKLDGALGNLIWWIAALPMAEVLELDGL